MQACVRGVFVTIGKEMGPDKWAAMDAGRVGIPWSRNDRAMIRLIRECTKYIPTPLYSTAKWTRSIDHVVDTTPFVCFVSLS